MAKKTKTEEEYADLVIQSLVQEDYSVPKATENAAVANEPEPIAALQSKKDKTKDVGANRKFIMKRNYEESFVRESGMTARKGKQVCIRSNYHDRIMKLIQVIGKNEVTIASYIDNVLASHFEDYQEDIAESFGKHIKTFTNI